MNEAQDQALEQTSTDWHEKIEQLAGKERALMKDAFKFAITSREPNVTASDENRQLLRSFIGDAILNELSPRIKVCETDEKVNMARVQVELGKPGIDPMSNLVLTRSVNFLQKLEAITEMPDLIRKGMLDGNMNETLIEMNQASQPGPQPA